MENLNSQDQSGSMLAYSRALLESQSEDNVTEDRKRSDLGSWSDLEKMSEEFPGPPRDHFACATFLSNPVIYMSTLYEKTISSFRFGTLHQVFSGGLTYGLSEIAFKFP